MTPREQCASAVRRCNICNAAVREVTQNGRAKVRRFRTGFVGVQLECGHWAAVSSPQLALELAPAPEVTP